MKIITNCKKCKTKWNSESHKKNERSEHEYHQLSRMNSVQWDENVRTQNHARNELATKT